MDKIDINKKYRTRDGKDPQYLHRAPEGWPYTHPWRGLVDNALREWTDAGHYNYNNEGSNFDLIEVPELEFDWSCLPAWAEWITKSECQRWAWFEKKPLIEHGYYVSEKGTSGFIHSGFLPNYNGGDPAPIFKRPSKEGGEA